LLSGIRKSLFFLVFDGEDSESSGELVRLGFGSGNCVFAGLNAWELTAVGAEKFPEK
jgi:hypothetical protein